MVVGRLVCLIFAWFCILKGADQPSIAVWIHDDVHTRRTLAMHMSTADALFAEVGVKVHWHLFDRNTPAPPPGAFTVHVIRFASEKATPAALATTRLSACAITIFADRILHRSESAHPSVRNKMLAYVMAHELAHAIQGISRHSNQGILKAAWTNADFADMLFDEFKFSYFDAALIRQRAALAGGSE